MSARRRPDVFDLGGKVALVTGGAGLLGVQHGRALAEIGARVALADIDEVAASRAAARINEEYGADSAIVLKVAARSPGRSSLMLIIENLLDRKVEKAGDAEGERQRGIVLAGLDRVDCLARDVEPDGQLGLAPIPLGAQNLEAVVHARVPRTRV